MQYQSCVDLVKCVCPIFCQLSSCHPSMHQWINPNNELWTTRMVFLSAVVTLQYNVWHLFPGQQFWQQWNYKHYSCHWVQLQLLWATPLSQYVHANSMKLWQPKMGVGVHTWNLFQKTKLVNILVCCSVGDKYIFKQTTTLQVLFPSEWSCGIECIHAVS